MGYYVYNIRVSGYSYVGQARTAQRVLSHLGGSSNRRLNQLLAKARHWPSIGVMGMATTCHGDLGIAESALTRIELERVGQANALNRRTESTTAWLRHDEESDEYSEELIRLAEEWRLASLSFCDARNATLVQQACGDLLQGKSLPGFNGLPAAGTPVRRLTYAGISRELGRLGVESAFVVPINQEVSDGRAPISPTTSEADLAERCLKYWVPSQRYADEVARRPPGALVAVIGGPAFRIVIGAWKVDSYDPETGIAVADQTFGSGFGQLKGAVIAAKERKFHQATRPIWWIRPRRLPVWVGSNAR